MKHVARAGLAVALLVGFYLLAVGLAVALLVALVQVLRLGFAGLPIALLFALVVPVRLRRAVRRLRPVAGRGAARRRS